MKVTLQHGKGPERIEHAHDDVHMVTLTDDQGREWHIYADNVGGVTVGLHGDAYLSGGQIAIVPYLSNTIGLRYIRPGSEVPS